MNTRILGCAAGILALLLSGCMASSGSSVSSNLQQQVARHDQQIQSLLSRSGQAESSLPGQAEMWSQLQNIRQELNQTYARLEDGEGGKLAERVNRLEALVRKMASQLAISTDSLDAPLPMSGTGYHPSTARPVTPPPVYGATGSVVVVNNAQGGEVAQAPESGAIAKDTGNSAKALYDNGIKAFDQRKYKDAIVAFKDFSAQYPKHKLTSNAYFWQGESYFQMKDYARAALAYQDVIAKFPGSAKFQAAMLKQGISLYHANKKDASKERLQELIKRYPNSPEATRAKQFMKTNT